MFQTLLTTTHLSDGFETRHHNVGGIPWAMVDTSPRKSSPPGKLSGEGEWEVVTPEVIFGCFFLVGLYSTEVLR